MKKRLKNFLLLSLPSLVVTLLLLELVFRFLIPASNTPDFYYEKNQQILHFDSSRNVKGIYTVGKLAEERAVWSINNFGWNSPYDYAKERTSKFRIAVIGDSYIESLLVDNKDIYPFRLQRLFNNAKEVYAFGVSGAPFSQYLHMSRYVNANFNPDVLIFNLVHNDFDESLTEYQERKYYKSFSISPDSTITEVEPTPYKLSLSKKLMKYSALIRYIYLNLKISSSFKLKPPANKIDYNANIDVEKTLKVRSRIELAMDYFCKKLKEENPGKEIMLVIDGPRMDLYQGKLSTSNVSFLNEIAKKYAAIHKLEVIDLTNVFEQDYQKNKKKFNSDLEYHWNGYAHQIVADTLYRHLTKNGSTLITSKF